MSDARSKEVAWETMLDARESVLSGASDPLIKPHLSTDLLKLVFDECWRGQFDEDQSSVQRAIRQVVDDGIAAADLEAKP